MGTKKARFLTCLVVVLSTFTPFKDSFAQGDITAVNAGKGLKGGGDTGDVTLSVKVPLDLTGASTKPIISGTNSCGASELIGPSVKCTGVFGGSSKGFGVIGKTDSKNGIAVVGRNTDSGSYGYIGGKRGVYGSSTSDIGVYGSSTSDIGVYGQSKSSIAVYGSNTNNGVVGYLGGNTVGVRGENHRSGNWGTLGDSEYGVYGQSKSSIAAYGKNTTSGNFGYLGSDSYGVYGESSQGVGVYGQSRNGHAVHGTNTNKGNSGSLGGSNFGVSGSSEHSTGVRGRSGKGYVDRPCLMIQDRDEKVGVLGDNCNGNYGSLGGIDSAVYGYSKFGHAIYGKSRGGAGYAGMFEGNVRVAGKGIVNVLQITGGSDLSELFEVRGNRDDLWPTPGMVVSIDPENPGDLVVSNQSYDRRVAGIISGAGGVEPGMLMGQQGSEADGANPVALSGRVYVRADASKGPIKPGDLLTTSDIPGHAMKVADYSRAQGATLGKAMSSLESGRGLVLVLVTLQ